MTSRPWSSPCGHGRRALDLLQARISDLAIPDETIALRAPDHARIEQARQTAGSDLRELER
jgi:hypothetical protein